MQAKNKITLSNNLWVQAAVFAVVGVVLIVLVALYIW
jgi:hypothetical protein